MPIAPRIAPAIDLLSLSSVLPPAPVRAPRPDIPVIDPYLNCSPRFMRSTMIFAPRSNVLLEKMKLPFGLHLYPFALDVRMHVLIACLKYLYTILAESRRHLRQYDQVPRVQGVHQSLC